MLFVRLWAMISSLFLVVGCINVIEKWQSQPKNLSQSVTVTQTSPEQIITKRINTTDCQDPDDWYLDGYRVGKSFVTQRQAMLQQRMNFCQFATLPSQFKQPWEQGFRIGSQAN